MNIFNRINFSGKYPFSQVEGNPSDGKSRGKFAFVSKRSMNRKYIAHTWRRIIIIVILSDLSFQNAPGIYFHLILKNSL